MKKCGSCFRFVENWRDARDKGLNERHRGFGEYSYKPRKGVEPRCMCGKVKEGIHEKHAPCEHHEYRWAWNFKIWWRWHFRQRISDWYRRNIRVPIGSLRKPVPLKFQDYYDGMKDRIISGGEPECPRCGEMPYSYIQCVFCGQKFLEFQIAHDKYLDEIARIQGYTREKGETDEELRGRLLKLMKND